MRISILQTDIVWENKQENLRRLREKLETLRGTTEIVVLPETFSTGFSMDTMIISYFSQKCSLFTKLVQHCQHITRCSARAGFEQVISLFTLSVHCKINQKFSHCDYVKIFFHLVSPSLFLVKVNQLFDRLCFFNMLCLQNRSGTFIH